MEEDCFSAPDAGSVEESNSTGSSLTLSLTPPLSDTPKNVASSISEHLSSIENDYSIQEIEVRNDFGLVLRHLQESDEEHLSQEPIPSSLNSSFGNNSIISLNALERFVENMEGSAHVKSILEEILTNEQFKSGLESNKESLDIFANVNLDDAMLNSYNLGRSADFKLVNELKSDSLSYDDVTKRVKDFEELIAIRDSTIAALTSELDSFREMRSNPSSTSLGTTTTEYKQLQEECHAKLVEYHNAIVHKDDIIQKLSESLHQSLVNREELKQQSDHFKNEIAQLQEQLEETSKLLKSHKCDPGTRSEVTLSNVEMEYSKLENTLTTSQLRLFNDVKLSLNQQFEHKQKFYANEIDNLRTKMEADKVDHDKEIQRLKEVLAQIRGSRELVELKQELDIKHSKEMEELRTYFERKCADLEKNYSEEVFSQHSRKMSGSSSCSDLCSDFIYNQPGPGGDNKLDYTKKDVVKIRHNLGEIITLIDRFNLVDLTDESFEELKIELKKIDFRNLLKYDLNLIRVEIQNKYHAELEILREDFDNRVAVINVEHENKLRRIEEKYREEVEDLAEKLRASASQMVSTAVQEVASSGEFEIDEVVQSYERRLQEQVTLAKIDIIAALECQIQRLAGSDTIDEDWPEELLQLKLRFSEKYQTKIDQLKHDHELEIFQLKEEHVKNLNGALERARRRSLRDADSLSKGELELLKERDCLKKQTLALRNLLGELLKYFTQCEDELNNTLVEELLKHGFDRSLTVIETDLDLGDSKRVHLAPDFSDLLNLIDNSTENDLELIDLKSELGICLEKLRSDANAILAATTNLSKSEELKTPSNLFENKVSSLMRQLISETQIKNELFEQLTDAKSIVQSLESERVGLETQLQQVLDKQRVVEGDLMEARDKIAELIENGHKEIVSEGYGDEGGKMETVDAVATLIELQAKARILTEHPANVDQNLLHLIEEFSRVAEKIVEESRRARDDLKQQIDAADKKYKVTCRFLEEQAAEREQERDEAQKNIDSLQEQLRDRNKDRTSCERIITEVEHLEQQLRDMSKLIEETDKRCTDAETERKEAVDKIFVLRDIIRDLELQVETKSRAEEELRNIVGELECLLKHQTKSDDEESARDLSRDVSHVHELHQHLRSLEGEVQRLRLSTEIAGSEGAIKQIRNHLCEFETTLDKRTKDLEGLHSAFSTSCSSPSEDMSIRDVVNPALSNSVFEECEVPLQQLARLKEKLVRHSRAEDAALKRIRDLEMQVFNIKNDFEECQGEKDILKKQISDQLVLISSLQIRLDDQRIRAEHIEKQTNTSLEIRIYDLQNDIASLEDKIAQRDKTITKLNGVIEETKQRLKKRDEEIVNVKENEIIAKMQEQLEALRDQNSKLKTRINETQMLPNLVENIIADKNNDIDELKEKLVESEKQLLMYSNLSLDKSQLEAFNKLRLSGISFIDLVDLDEPDVARRIASRNESLSSSHHLEYKRSVNQTVFLGMEPEISNIEKVGPSQMFYSLQSSAGKPNSTEKHVRFEDEIADEKLKELQEELQKKNEVIQDYEDRLKTLVALEDKVAKLQTCLEETENILKKASAEFENEQKEGRENEKILRLDVAAKRLEIDEQQEQLQAYVEELKQFKLLSADFEETRKHLQAKEGKIAELESEVTKIQTEMSIKQQQSEDQLKQQKELLNEELQKYRYQIRECHQKLQDFQSNDMELHKITEEKEMEVAELKKTIRNFDKEVVHLQHLLAEKEKIIDHITADSHSLHVNLETIQTKLHETGNVVDLGRRLREEQKKNWELVEEIHGLKAQLLSVDKKSIDEITGQVQKELEYSAYLDASLINAVTDQPSIENLKNELDKQKSTNKELVKAKEHMEKTLGELEVEHEELKIIVKKLQAELEMEKLTVNSIQLEDGKLIEQMRIRLDSALNNEIEYEKILEAEKQQRLDLEKQVVTMKQRIYAMSGSSKIDSLENKELEDDKIQLQKRLGMLQEKYDDLDSRMKLLNQDKEEVDRSLKCTQNFLKSKDRELQTLQDKIEVMTTSEKVLKQKLFELKVKFEEKLKQVANYRTTIEQMEHDRTLMKQRMDQFNQRLKETPKGQTCDSQQLLPEQLMKKIREINIAVTDNIQMVDIISRLTNEKIELERRIVELEHHHFNAVPFNDPSSRADYLFAKLLRSESHRKALVFQKRYMTLILARYQVTKSSNREAQPTNTQVELSSNNGKNRFKSVVNVVIAISRMKYIVKRWHSGKRMIQQRSDNHTAQFHVGQPVSSQNFSCHEDVVVSASGLEQSPLSVHATLPWSGNSPPSKDHHRNLYKSTLEPLAAPGLLSKYVERFNQIQERLGMTMGPTPSS